MHHNRTRTLSFESCRCKKFLEIEEPHERSTGPDFLSNAEIAVGAAAFAIAFETSKRTSI
jgi:hypothetical protein